MTDQDDFQFRPLTEGLGFHRQTKETAAPLQSPLPRKGMEMRKSPMPLSEPVKNNTVDEILKTLNEKRSLDFTDKKKFLNETPATTFQPSSFDLSAGLLDAMLITAASLLCLIILLVVTRVDLFNNLYHPDAQNMIYLSLLALVAGITWIYLVGNRVFLGFTPGEWVFDQRLGTPEQMGSAEYALKIVARSTAVLVTGLFLFPLFSFIFNSDLLGKLVGAELMKQSRG